MKSWHRINRSATTTTNNFFNWVGINSQIRGDDTLSGETLPRPSRIAAARPSAASNGFPQLVLLLHPLAARLTFVLLGEGQAEAREAPIALRDDGVVELA